MIPSSWKKINISLSFLLVMLMLLELKTLILPQEVQLMIVVMIPPELFLIIEKLSTP